MIFQKALTLTLILSAIYTTETRKVGSCIQNTQGHRCSQPGAQWQHDAVCIIEPTKSPTCHVPDTRYFKFQLVAKIQAKNAPSIRSLWVRGSGPTLSWEKPRQMLKSARSVDEWNLEISYASDSNALLCVNSSYCTLNQHALELRVYKDEPGNNGMLGPNIYVALPISNSMSGVVGVLPPRVQIYPWFSSTSVKTENIILQHKSYLSKADETISITSTIIYPPSFDSNINKMYPLVIMFGKNEPAYITPLLEHLFVHEASINEALVVSIHYLDKAPFCAFSPFNELSQTTETNTVWNCKARDQNCHTCQTCWDDQRVSQCTPIDFISKARRCLAKYACNGSASDILDFIETILVPELRERTRNRLQLDFPRQRMSIIGFSGAGLLACFAALSRPLHYANAACLSAPFEWPVGEQMNKNIEGMGRLMKDLNATFAIQPENRALYTSQKYYIDVGEFDNFYLPHVDALKYSKWMVGLLKETLSLKLSENIIYFNVPKGSNSYYHQKDGGTEVFNRVKQPLLFFLRAEGGPNKMYPRIPKLDDASFAERQLELEPDLNRLISNQLNETAVEGSHCSAEYRQRLFKSKKLTVPIPAFLVTLVVTILLSVMLTAGFMYLREFNKKAQEKDKKEEEDELEEELEKLGSDLEDLEDLDK